MGITIIIPRQLSEAGSIKAWGRTIPTKKKTVLNIGSSCKSAITALQKCHFTSVYLHYWRGGGHLYSALHSTLENQKSTELAATFWQREKLLIGALGKQTANQLNETSLTQVQHTNQLNTLLTHRQHKQQHSTVPSKDFVFGLCWERGRKRPGIWSGYSPGASGGIWSWGILGHTSRSGKVHFAGLSLSCCNPGRDMPGTCSSLCADVQLCPHS